MKKDYGDEQVLSIPREKLQTILGLSNLSTGFYPDFYQKINVILENSEFINRTDAETDPSYKQIIPYCIIRQNGKVLSYRRGVSGGENRLHGKLSIGVGGHINPVDTEFEDFPDLSFATIALIRELKEEIGVDLLTQSKSSKFVGYINDETNEAGQVHFGLAYVVDLIDDVEFAFEDCLNLPEWMGAEEIKKSENIEFWSEIFIKEL